MIIAYHVIFGMYGFWLPNDPRGSWSDFVASWNLFRYGHATKVTNRRSHAWDHHDVALRLKAKDALKFAPVVLNGRQALSVGRGFARVAQSSGYAVHACAILPDHVHLVLGRHHYGIEQVMRRLKQSAGSMLREEGLHPLAEFARDGEALPTPFARRFWNCFIDSDEYARSAIEYVQRNPEKEGKKRQRWSFVSQWG